MKEIEHKTIIVSLSTIFYIIKIYFNVVRLLWTNYLNIVNYYYCKKWLQMD